MAHPPRAGLSAHLQRVAARSQLHNCRITFLGADEPRSMFCHFRLRAAASLVRRQRIKFATGPAILMSPVSSRALTQHNHTHGHTKNFEVKKKAPIMDIMQIIIELVLRVFYR
jgi:hypothetical protein